MKTSAKCQFYKLKKTLLYDRSDVNVISNICMHKSCKYNRFGNMSANENEVGGDIPATDNGTRAWYFGES